MKPSIPIAVSTGSLYPLSTLESIQQLQKLGVQDVELTLQTNEFSLTFERTLSMPVLSELLVLVQAGQLRVRSVHAPSLNSAHANNLWARKEYLLHSIETCRILGGGLLVVHPSHLLRTQEDALDYLSGDGVLLESALLPGIRQILDQARLANIILALENIQDWLDEVFFNNPQNMFRFLAEMNHPSLMFTFDLMHAQVSGFLEEFAGSLAANIVNVHASDLLPPWKRVSIGKGVIDWQRLVPMLKVCPNLRQITVELSNPQPEELSQSIALLSGLIS